MPSLGNIIGQASRGADLYFVFRFLRLLTMKYTSTDAYKLGIIDKKGKALKKSADLESIKEKAAYTMLHRMVFKIRGLIEKVPLVGKSILLNYAAALFLLKEQKDPRIWTDDIYMKTKLLEFLETNWEADAKFLKEEVDNMEKKSFTSFLSENKTIEESQELQALMALDDAGIEAVIDKKGRIVVKKKDIKKAEKALSKSFRKGGEPDLYHEEVELTEEFSEKDFDALKRGDIITIEFKSSMSSGTSKFKVTAKNIVGKAKVHKATLQNVKNPKSVKFFLYKRGNKVSLAQGDMAASVVKYTIEQLEERKMTDGEKEEREEIVKKLKPKFQSFKDRYGDDAKKVMYATATKQAMEEFKLGEGWKKGKYKVTDGKTGKVLGTFNSGGKAQKFVDDLFQKGDYESLTVELDEAVELEEKKSSSGYELYHKTFSAAMQHAYDHAKSKGHIVDPKEIDDKVATGPKKPSSGKTNRYSLKAGRKKVEIQVANLDNKRYELNMYIEGVELTEALKPKDKKVVDDFYDQKEDDQPKATLSTDGKSLWIAGSKAAEWKNGKIEILHAPSGRFDQSVFKYMRKSIPKLNFAKEEMGNVAPTAPDSGGIQYQAPVLGQKKKKKIQKIDEAVQKTTFAGKDVFIVDSETFYNCRLGKKKYGRYEKYVGDGKVGQTIREYGLKYPRRPIILQNGESGPMLYLKYGRS